MIIISRILVLVFCVFFLPCAAAEDRLRKYSTPVVRLYTDVSKEQAQEVIADVTFWEEWIDSFFRSFGISAKKTNPIRCVLYVDPQDFVETRAREHNIGSADFAYFSIGNNRIVGSFSTFGDFLDETGAARAALRRECARQIVNRYFSNPPPAWFDEGFSRYFEGLEFDAQRKQITDCGEFSRFNKMRSTAERLDSYDWSVIFDERPVDYYNRRDGSPGLGGVNSTLSWAIIFYYMNMTDQPTDKLFWRFMQGMNTGRERSRLLMEDLKKREKDFLAFFGQDHQEVWRLFQETEKLREEGELREALVTLLRILEKDDRHQPALYLAAEICWEDHRFEPSLIFWRRLASIEPKNALFQWKVCRCLIASGTRHKNEDTLTEAVRMGKQAVQYSRSQDPDSHAALAMAYHALGQYREALVTLRKATYLGGPNLNEYKQLESTYSQDLQEFYRTRK